MPVQTIDDFLKADQPLVNEKEAPGVPTIEDYLRPPSEEEGARQRAEAKYRESRMPKTWFGELTHGFSRGVDLMQQTAYGVGALASDVVGLEGARDYFIKAVQEQDKDIAESPGRAETYKDVKDFDTFMRYVFSGAGEVAPNIAESVVTGLAGAAIGSAAEPGGGTVVGGVAGLIGKKAARKLIMEGVEELTDTALKRTVKTELLDYAKDRVAYESLQDGTKAILGNEIRRTAGQYGATQALAMSAISQEVGSIYSDLLDDPNLSESDRKIAALVGGFAAGSVEGIFEGYIASKFFKTPKVNPAQVSEAKNYLTRFTQSYGKEILKVVPGESGTEFAQTVIEEAAKNYADPEKRDAIFSFDDQQKKAFIDATFKGAIGGLLGGGVSAVADTRAHPNPQVRIAERDIAQQAEDITPSAALDVEAGPDDVRLSAILTRQKAIEEELAKTDVTPEIRRGLEEENTRLETEYNAILGEQAIEAAPLVNEKETAPAPTGTTPAATTPTTPSTTPAPEASLVGSVLTDEALMQYGLTPAEAVAGGYVQKVDRGYEVTAEGARKFKPKSPLQTAIEQVQALQGKKMGKREMGEVTETLDEEAATAKYTQIHSLVTENVKDSQLDEDTKKAYVTGIMSAFDVPTVNFLAKEGIQVRRATKAELKERLGGQDAFAAFDDDDGNIVITIPNIDKYITGAVKKAPQESLQIFKNAQRREAETTEQTIQHEVIHAADLVNIRNRYNENNQGFETFGEFENHYINQRGAVLRNALPALAKILHSVYYRSLGEGTNRQLGYEFMRMLIEANRTGKIGEVTDALLRAERAAEGNTKGYISSFLAQWFDAIKGLYEQIQRFFNPETAPAEIKKQFDEINALLDQYGVIMDDYPVELAEAETQEQEQASVEEKAPVEEKPAKPTKAKLTAIDRAEAKLVKAIDRAKAKKAPIVEAMRAHMALQRANEQPVTKDNLDKNARAFKELYGKGATLKLYKEAAATEVLVNEKKPAPKAKPGEAKIPTLEAIKQATAFVGRKALLEEAQSLLDTTFRNLREQEGDLKQGLALEFAARRIIKRFTETDQTKIASDLGLTYNGTMMERLDLYTDRDENSPSYGTTFSVPFGANFEAVQAMLNERREMFANAPKLEEGGGFRAGDDRPAAQAKPRMSKRESNKLARAEMESNSYRNQQVGEIPTRDPERKRVQGDIPAENVAQSDLYYDTRPHTNSTIQAQVLVNEMGGAVKMAEHLQQDPLGQELDIIEEGDPENQYGPDAVVSAIYENVVRQLDSVISNLEQQSADTETVGYIHELQKEMYDAMKRIGNRGGSFNSYRGMNEKLINGVTARREYVDTLTDHASKVLGKDAKKKMSKLSQELNDLWQKYAGVVTNSSKVISVIRRLQKLVDKSKFEKGFRKTITKSIDRLKAITKKSAARAADHVSLEEDGEAYVNQAIKNVMLEMTRPAKDTEMRGELDLVQMVLERMGKGATEDARIPRPKGRNATNQEVMAAIMRNEGLYQDFIQQLYTTFLNEYGGVNPSPELVHHAEEIYARLSNRMWQQGMVRSLVNEKMAEFNLKFSEIVRDSYGRGQYEVDKIRDHLTQYMREHGVDNEDLINQLAQDIESEMNHAIEEARERFFSSRGGITSFLKNMQTTLGNAAKQHATYVEGMEKKFEDELVRLGIPNEPGLPIAATLAAVMQNEFNKLVQAERVKIVRRWMETAAAQQNTEKQTNEVKRKLDQTVEKILQLANIGALRIEDVYRSLEKKFDLPPFSEETARQIQDIGDRIGNAQYDRQKDILRQELSDLLAGKRGLKTSDAYTSWMYFSMLSGPGTQLVNIGANLTSLMGYIAVEAVKHPLRIPRMLKALFVTAAGKGQLEARESFFTGYALGKQGEKYYRKGNPAELADVFFKSGYAKNHPRLAKAEEAFAKGVHKVLRGTKSYFIGRALMASDVFFYKIAQEMAYTARMGYQAVTPQARDQAMLEARQAMMNDNQNPDTSRELKRRQAILASEILENKRLHDDEGNLVNEREVAWREAGQEALDATFQQEPTGFLGFLSKHLEAFTRDMPIGKLLIPFTRVVANVANHMLEWTPYGFARYAFLSLENGKNPLAFWNEFRTRKESDVFIRAGLGMAAMIVLMALAAETADDDDPEFAIYGDGPRDLNARRQLQARGWKPNSIKVGNAYYSYLFTPLAMALSIVGRHMDDYRDGRIPSPSSVSLASSAVALIESVKNQSFLASASDLMAAVDSPDPQAKVSRVFARVATIPLPNIFKQIDKVIDPSVQQATGFWESFVKEFPIARHTLKPALNVFGEAVDRTPGLIRMPGMDRFVTMERTDDPVLTMIGDKRIVIPGFSKGTKMGDVAMTEEQYYEYVQLAGPKIKSRISAEIRSIESLAHDDAQDRIEKIASEEKAAARRILRQKYGVSR